MAILVVNKTVLQYAKTVIRFHDTYLLGKPVQLSCNDENTLKTFSDIYKLGQYDSVDYQIIDRVNKFGDAYETIYVDNGVIKSKVLDNACSYPAYDDMGNYIAFIENWTDAYTAITYWNVYYPSDVDVIYNVSMPVASTEMIANLKALQEMGAISRETIMEKTEYITDVDVEKKRLQGENVAAKLDKDVANVPKDKTNPSNEIGDK